MRDRWRDSAWMTPGARWSVTVLFIYFTVGLGGGYALAINAIHRAESNAATTVQLCQSGNEARAEIIGFGEYLVAISKPPPHETAAQRAQREQIIRTFLAHLHTRLAPRNCAHPARTEPTP